MAVCCLLLTRYRSKVSAGPLDGDDNVTNVTNVTLVFQVFLVVIVFGLDIVRLWHLTSLLSFWLLFPERVNMLNNPRKEAF
jgi:hypothetical protein